MADAGLDRINALPESELQQELAQCCTSERWAAAVAGGRPFGSVGALSRASDAAFDTLTDTDWREAFRGSAVPDLSAFDEGTRNATLVALRLYEERFGYPFVISADRLGGDEFLMRVRIRLGLEPDAQMRATRYEQVRLTRARLQRLIERSG